MNPLLHARFPHASKAVQELNSAVPKVAFSETLSEEPKRKTRVMNKTEGAFANLLQAKVNRGELVKFDYEGMSLRWSGMTYTPDFVAVRDMQYIDTSQPMVRLIFYEVKGAHIYSRDMVRFKGARGNYPLFDFQMWQYKAREWTRLL